MTKSATIIILIVFLALTGCADAERDRLKRRVDQLEEQQITVARKEAQLDFLLSEQVRLDKAAYWAAWCDYIVPTCPSAAIAEGRALIIGPPGRIVEGVGVSKIAALLLWIGSTAMILGWVWAYAYRPSKSAIAAARAEIAGAKMEVEKVKRRAQADREGSMEELELLEKKLNNARKKARDEIDRLQRDQVKATENLREIDQKIVAGERKIIALEKKARDTDRVRNAFK